MNFIIVPSTLLEGKEDDLAHLGLNPRYSNDLSEVLLHLESYDILCAPILPEDIKVYNYNSPELSDILSSDNWNKLEVDG